MAKIFNPARVFLVNCEKELDGVCMLDRSFFDHSGTLSGHTAMASMLSKWLCKTVFIIGSISNS